MHTDNVHALRARGCLKTGQNARHLVVPAADEVMPREFGFLHTRSFSQSPLTRNEAIVAVRIDTNPTPKNIMNAARMRPGSVTGKRSPYPTVITVTTAHQMPSCSDLMLAPSAVCSK